MLLDILHDVFPRGTLQSAWRLSDKTVEAEKMQGLCRLGVRQLVAFAELCYVVLLIPCWNSEDRHGRHPKQKISDVS